jgi:hypothetical protein
MDAMRKEGRRLWRHILALNAFYEVYLSVVLKSNISCKQLILAESQHTSYLRSAEIQTNYVTTLTTQLKQIILLTNFTEHNSS